MTVTTTGLIELLTRFVAEEPSVADLPIYLGHDPEGNPPFHAFTHDADQPGLALADIFGKPSLILWAGYPQAWDDDVDFGDEEED